MANPINVTQAQPPTYELPAEFECGSITFRPADAQLFEVLHWQEDGDLVFRSTEFDILAAAPTREQAILQFLENAEDLLSHLQELRDAGGATEHEIETAAALASRFDPVRRYLQDEYDRESRRLVSIHIGRRRRASRGYVLSPRQPTTSSSSRG